MQSIFPFCIMKNVAKTVKRKLNESLATQKYDINIYIESSDCLISITEKDIVRKSLMQEQDKTMQEIAFVLNKLKKNHPDVFIDASDKFDLVDFDKCYEFISDNKNLLTFYDGPININRNLYNFVDALKTNFNDKFFEVSAFGDYYKTKALSAFERVCDKGITIDKYNKIIEFLKTIYNGNFSFTRPPKIDIPEHMEPWHALA